jgi:site-specific DNA-methyltransferase (adenine-specific)
MYSHSITKDTYSLIPILDMKEAWTDEKLYKKYGLTEDEISFIESMIRPMDLSQKDELDE